jgi:hypothetical protein
MEVYDEPTQLTPKNVIYWYEKSGELISDQKGKAIKFIENNCVLSSYDDKWVVKHIPGYNKTNHKVDMKNQTCSCQYNRLYNKECSHILAIKIYKFMNNWKK